MQQNILIITNHDFSIEGLHKASLKQSYSTETSLVKLLGKYSSESIIHCEKFLVEQLSKQLERRKNDFKVSSFSGLGNFQQFNLVVVVRQSKSKETPLIVNTLYNVTRRHTTPQKLIAVTA